jgi:hypothetical protein
MKRIVKLISTIKVDLSDSMNKYGSARAKCISIFKINLNQI